MHDDREAATLHFALVDRHVGHEVRRRLQQIVDNQFFPFGQRNLSPTLEYVAFNQLGARGATDAKHWLEASPRQVLHQRHIEVVGVPGLPVLGEDALPVVRHQVAQLLSVKRPSADRSALHRRLHGVGVAPGGNSRLPIAVDAPVRLILDRLSPNIRNNDCIHEGIVVVVNRHDVVFPPFHRREPPFSVRRQPRYGVTTANPGEALRPVLPGDFPRIPGRGVSPATVAPFYQGTASGGEAPYKGMKVHRPPER